MTLEILKDLQKPKTLTSVLETARQRIGKVETEIEQMRRDNYAETVKESYLESSEYFLGIFKSILSEVEKLNLATSENFNINLAKIDESLSPLEGIQKILDTLDGFSAYFTTSREVLSLEKDVLEKLKAKL